MTRPTRLRYGLLLDSFSVPRWQALVLDELDKVDGVECVVVGANTVREHRPQVSDLWSRRRLAWTAYNRWASRRATSLAPVDLTHWAAPLPAVELPFERVGSWQIFDHDACAALSEQRPDFLLRLGFGLIRGPILDAAPMGVWSFHHGDEREYRGGPPCFWELIDGASVTGVLLQRLNERIDGGVPLARASFPTIPHSYRRNRDQAYLGAVQLPAQVSRRILAGELELPDGTPSPSTAAVRRPPDGRALLRSIPLWSRAWIRRQVTGLTAADRWHVGVVDRPIQSFLDRPALDDVTWLPRPTGSDRYVADPFGCDTESGSVVLVEDYHHGERHGRISMYRSADGVTAGAPQPVRTFEVHASYPFLVNLDGEWWCIPEVSASRKVVALRFDPKQGELGEERVLLDDVSLADPTLFRRNGLLWLFGTDRDMGANTHLRAWWAQGLEGPWRLHAVDPLAIDVRRSRGAGTPFVHDGQLYRPAQDCSDSYGGAVTINRIDQLDRRRFDETIVGRVLPEPDGDYPDGVHTLSALGERTLVDGTVHRFSFAAFRHEVAARALNVVRAPSPPR